MTICVECKPDFITVEEITSINTDVIRHCGGKTRVILDLNNYYVDSKGLVDQDPDSSKPRSIEVFKTHRNLHNERILVLFNEEKRNYLIVLRPRLEGWILRTSRLAGINVADYGLPTEEKKLIVEINYLLDEYRKLIQDLNKISPVVKLLGTLLLDP